MRPRNIIFVLLLIISLAVGVGFIYLYFVKPGSSINSIIPQSVETFTIVEARQVAERNLVFFESWKGAKIEMSYTLYDLKNNPSAYLFTVTDYYGKAGYMVIGATDRQDPIVQSSKELQSPFVLLTSLTSKIAQDTGRRSQDIKSEMIYLGGLDYFGKLTFREGSEVTEKFYSLNGYEEKTLEEMNAKQFSYEKLHTQGSNEMWDNELKK